MADNYLEKRYAELFEGSGSKPATSAVSRPSLDTLVKRAAEAMDPDPAYVLHPLQLQTIAALAPEGVSCELRCEGSHGSITFRAADGFQAGMAARTMVLKAVELGLRASAKPLQGNGAEISICKNKSQR